jgi:hypothetical protein
VLDRSDTVCDNGVKIVQFTSVFLRFSRLHEYGRAIRTCNDALTEAEEESSEANIIDLIRKKSIRVIITSNFMHLKCSKKMMKNVPYKHCSDDKMRRKLQNSNVHVIFLQMI